jgi:hypothetical protein
LQKHLRFEPALYQRIKVFQAQNGEKFPLIFEFIKSALLAYESGEIVLNENDTAFNHLTKKDCFDRKLELNQRFCDIYDSFGEGKIIKTNQLFTKYLNKLSN